MPKPILTGMSGRTVVAHILNGSPGVAPLECEGCGQRTHGYCQRCPAALCGLCRDGHECPALS